MSVKYYLFFFLTLIYINGHTQETNSSNVGIEIGVTGYYNSIKEKDYIRRLSSSQNDEGSQSNKFSSLLITAYVGLKFERTFFNDRLGIMSGVRFTKANSTFGLKGIFRYNNYFYLLAREDGTTTDYLYTKELSQESSYIGIPLEVRYMFFNSSFTRLYFKIGSVFDFRTKSKNEVELVAGYAAPILLQEAANKSGTPADFNTSIYGGIGMRLGRGFPLFNIELTLPAFLLTSNYSTLVNPHAGTGIHFMFQIPLKSKK